MKPIRLETERLYLRQWEETDFELFAEMNSDRDIMEYFPKLLSIEESNAMALKCQALIEEKGWGFWAVSLKENNTFIGFVGLHQPQYDFPFNPCVEIGWRLRKEFWGYGYATEAAKAALKFAFEELELKEIVAITSCTNKRSQLVMERLSMKDTGKNWHHPEIETTNPLSEHVLYKLTQEEWKGDKDAVTQGIK